MVRENIQAVGRHRRLEDSDNSDNDEKEERVLTVAKAADQCPKEFRLIARNAGFTSIDDLSTLKKLDYVDLSNNLLTSVAGLSGNRRLKTVNLLSNRLSDLQPLLRCETIRVLNVSENPLPTLEWLRYSSFSAELLTLVSTGNRIASLDGIRALKQVRTLILSHNQLENLEPLAGLSRLEKLSVSHNELRTIPPQLGELHQLRELRISHNRIAELPSAESLSRMTSLTIFDVGHNIIHKFDVLSACSNVTNINLRGNPGCETLGDVEAFVRRQCPKIQIIDGTRVAGGRRKVRINRLRVATGMPIETDRQFARPPPTAAVKRLLERKGSINNLDDATKAEGVRILERAAGAVASKSLSQDDGDDSDVEKGKEIKKKRLNSNEINQDLSDGTEMKAANQNESKEENIAGAPLSTSMADDNDTSKPKTRESDGNENLTADKNSRDINHEIQAADFVRQAKSNAAAKSMGGARVKHMNKKRKHGLRKTKNVPQALQFGDGGDSQW